MSKTEEDAFKIGFGVWFSLCLALCVWFLGSFIKGRRQFQTNLHVIEDGLRKMQEELDIKQRKKSNSYGEDMEEITALLKKTLYPETENEKQDESRLLDDLQMTTEGQEDQQDAAEVAESDDKKNV